MDTIAVRRDVMLEDIRFGFGKSSLGEVLVAINATGVAAILMGDNRSALRRELANAFPRACLIADDAELDGAVAKVAAFIEAPQHGLDLPLDIRGSALEQAV